MKKWNTRIIASIIALTASCATLQARNEIPTPKAHVPTERDHQTSRAAEDRIYEIYRMDKASLNATEKQQLRDEVKGIKRAITGPSGGVYISAGAIIIILLILLILI